MKSCYVAHQKNFRFRDSKAKDKIWNCACHILNLDESLKISVDSIDRDWFQQKDNIALAKEFMRFPYFISGGIKHGTRKVDSIEFIQQDS